MPGCFERVYGGRPLFFLARPFVWPWPLAVAVGGSVGTAGESGASAKTGKLLHLGQRKKRQTKPGGKKQNLFLRPGKLGRR